MQLTLASMYYLVYHLNLHLQPTPINRHRYHNPRSKNNYNSSKINIENHENKLFNGVILSDSMLSHVRTDAIKKSNLINVKLSYESGCDCIKILQWLRSPQGHNTVKGSDFLIFCLGINDVRRYELDASFRRRKSEIFITNSMSVFRSYPINWILTLLMRVEDGLHPSFTTGKSKHKAARRNWFSTHAVTHSYVIFQRDRLPSTMTTTKIQYTCIIIIVDLITNNIVTCKL